MATDVADLRLNVRIDAGEGPVIVMLHGINANADDMRPLIDQLGPRYRIIAPDVLGFGDSPKPLYIDYTTDENVQVLDATLTDLGVTEPFLLLGYSMGGVIAVRYAATHPEKLRRLFLLSTPFYLPPEAYSKHRFGLEYAQAMVFTWMWKVVGRQKERDTPFYELAAGPLKPQAEEFLRAGEISEHWEVMARTLANTISPASMIDDLPRLTMPTVFALGVRDPIVRPDQTQALQRIKPDLEIRRIMGVTADHLLIKSTPERVAAEVLRDEIDTLSIGLRTGHGEPLVLLPDLQETWRTWETEAGALGADHDVVALDLLGFGDSPSPLASRYTLDDHAAAVLATARKAFGDQRFQIAGKRFGATVALACADADPRAVSRVVAISALLPDPTRGDHDPATAQLLAARDTLIASARDERMLRITNERVQREVVPAVRSMSALVATDAPLLVGRLRTEVRFVIAGASTQIPDWLVARALAEPGLVTVDSTPGISNPELSQELVCAAVRGIPLPPVTANPDPFRPRPARRDPVSAMLGGLNARLLLRGGLQALLGLPLLLWPGSIPIPLVAAVLALGLGIEAAQMLVGAIRLRRRTRPWLAWAAVGGLGLAFALSLLAGGLFALSLATWIIIIGAGLRGAALLLVALKASRTPGRRWVLVVDGLLSLTIAIALLSWPPLGARLLRYAVGGYLTASGASSIVFAYGNQRAARKRTRQYLRKAP